MQDGNPLEPPAKPNHKITFDGEGGFKGDMASPDAVTLDLTRVAEWEKALGLGEDDLGELCDHMLPPEERARKQSERKQRREAAARIARLEQRRSAFRYSIAVGVIIFLFSSVINVVVVQAYWLVVVSMVISLVSALFNNSQLRPSQEDSHNG